MFALQSSRSRKLSPGLCKWTVLIWKYPQSKVPSEL